MQSKNDSCLLFILRGAVTVQTSHAKDQHQGQHVDLHSVSRPDCTDQLKDHLNQHKISKPDKADHLRDQPDQRKLSRSDQPHHLKSQQTDAVQPSTVHEQSTHLKDSHSAQSLHSEDNHSAHVLGQCNGEGQQSETTDQSNMQDSGADKQVLDARGLALGLPGAMQQAPLDIQVAANIVVEAFEVPWACMQVPFRLWCCLPVCRMFVTSIKGVTLGSCNKLHVRQRKTSTILQFAHWSA